MLFRLFAITFLTTFLYADALAIEDTLVNRLCSEIGGKLGSVNSQDCRKQILIKGDGISARGRPLAYKIYPPLASRKPLGKVLLMGGIHGDEYAAISILFKWMEKLNQYHSGLFHWEVVPLLNPDGLLEFSQSQRQNANGVDLNRNFPSSDWDSLAHAYWEQKTFKNPRRYPGKTAMSEPETRWFVDRIKAFQPDVIIAVHAPHRLVDYDGPQNAPLRLGSLKLRQLGIYPGSLGNYAGIDLKLPVVTVELASAGTMPSDDEISHMWVDLIKWLAVEIPKKSNANKSSNR
jgi:hypothetical protein